MGSITLVLGVALIIFNIFVPLVVNSFVDLPTIAVFGEWSPALREFLSDLNATVCYTTWVVLGSEKFTLGATPWCVESATIVHLVYLSVSIFSADSALGMFAALFCAPGTSLSRLVSFPGFSLWFHAVFHRLHSSRIKYTKYTGRLRLFSASIKLVPPPTICKRLLPPVPVAQHNCRFSVDAFM